MACVLRGPINWMCTRDREGFREYRIQFLVEGTAGFDGPANALQTPGLPVPGTFWFFFADLDVYAWCRWEAEVRPHQPREGERGAFFVVEQTFSTRPLEADSVACHNNQVGDPLLEPQKVSGGWSRRTELARYDKDGVPILNSAYEEIDTPENEWDASSHVIRVEQNVPLLQLAMCESMKDTLNDRQLWGLPARAIKLSGFNWRAMYYGTCLKYYQRSFEFEASYSKEEVITLADSGGLKLVTQLRGTWDRLIRDVGTKVLRGAWDKLSTSATFKRYVVAPGMSKTNPAHFIRFQDWNGNHARVVLDGHGRPWDPDGVASGHSASGAGRIFVQKYKESNFLELGIPVDIG